MAGSDAAAAADDRRMENRDLEAWADALLDQHRTAPRAPQHNSISLADLDPATRLMIEAGVTPPAAVAASAPRKADAADPMQRMYAVVGIAGGILLLLFLFTLLAAA